jgi:peptidylprolyl isomerase
MSSNPVVIFATNQGHFEIELMPKVAPLACENFLSLVAKGYYDGQIFHRVIKDFMIQGGDPTGTGRGGESIWGKDFDDECSKDVLFDKPGILAMANRGPKTNGSQFFITTAKTTWLHMRHTIFGFVSEGMDVIRMIEKTATDSQDKPKEPQVINRVYLKETSVN